MGSIIVLRKVVERGLSAMKTPPKYDENECMIASEGDSPEAKKQDIKKGEETTTFSTTTPKIEQRVSN